MTDDQFDALLLRDLHKMADYGASELYGYGNHWWRKSVTYGTGQPPVSYKCTDCGSMRPVEGEMCITPSSPRGNRERLARICSGHDLEHWFSIGQLTPHSLVTERFYPYTETPLFDAMAYTDKFDVHTLRVWIEWEPDIDLAKLFRARWTQPGVLWFLMVRNYDVEAHYHAIKARWKSLSKAEKWVHEKAWNRMVLGRLYAAASPDARSCWLPAARVTGLRAQRDRFDLIRKRAVAICVALAALDLSALELVVIISRACGVYSPCVSMYQKWALVTTIKHHRRRGR